MSISTSKKVGGGILAASMIFALAACGQAPTDAGSGSGDGSAAPADSDFLPCIVSDAGGFDDKSFNQLSYEGVLAAAKKAGVEATEVESNSETDYASNLATLVGENCTTIVSVGFALSAATIAEAKANPDIDFILVDDAADGDFDGKKDAENIKPLVYDTAQAAFLAGYLSAGYSKAGKVGTYGGMEFPTVTIFMDGFKQGVDFYNKENGKAVQVVGWDGKTGSFTGGFEANQEAKNVATNILDQDVDVIFPVGGPIYQSALQAITESGRDVALIGADADLYNTDPKTQAVVLTSVLKAMDLSTEQAVTSSAEGKFDAEAYIGTLENEGVNIAPLHDFESKVDAELVKKVEDLKAKIISGEVKVTSYLS